MTFLHIRTSGDNFTRLSTGFPTYAEAVAAGQDLGGPRNFYVETSGVPSREEQLLQPVRKRPSRKSSLNARVAKELNL